MTIQVKISAIEKDVIEIRGKLMRLERDSICTLLFDKNKKKKYHTDWWIENKKKYVDEILRTTLKKNEDCILDS